MTGAKTPGRALLDQVDPPSDTSGAIPPPLGQLPTNSQLSGRALLDQVDPPIAAPTPDQAAAPLNHYTAAQVPGAAWQHLYNSAEQFYGSVGHALTHPIQTVQNVASAVGSIPGAIAQAVGNPAVDPNTLANTATAIGQHYKDAYGGYDNIKRSLAEHPVQTLADLSTALTAGGGGLGAAADAGSLAARLAAGATRVGEAISPMNPFGLTNRAANVAGHAVRGVANAVSPTNNLVLGSMEGRGPAILNALNNAEPIVPGSPLTAAQAAAPVGATRFSALGAGAKDLLPTQSNDIQNARNTAHIAQIQQIGGTPEQLQAAIDARNAQANADYAAAGVNRSGGQVNNSRPVYESMPAAINNKVWYHGTGTPDLTPDVLSPNNTNVQGLFGHGVYMTDNPDIAAGYANAGRNAKGTPTVYQAKVNMGKVLDLDQAIPGDAQSIFERAGDGVDPSVGDAVRESVNSGGNGQAAYKAFANAIADHSQGEQIPMSEMIEHFQDLSSNLKDAGYDAFTHTGGARTGNPAHQVLIALDPNNELGSAPLGSRPQNITSFAPVPKVDASGVTTGQQINPVMIPSDDDLRNITNTPAGRAAFEQAQRIAANRQQPFQLGGAGPAQYSANDLHNVKMSFDNMIANPDQFGIGSADVGAVRDLRNQFGDWLENQNPAYATARQNYAAASGPIDQMRIGQYLQGKLQNPTMGEDTATLRADSFSNALDNATNDALGNSTIRKATGQQRYRSLGDVLTPEQMDQIQSVQDDLSRAKQTEAQANVAKQYKGNLNTAASDATDIHAPGVLGIPGAAFNILKNAFAGHVDARTAERVANNMLTPQTAAPMVQNALNRQARLDNTSNIIKGAVAPLNALNTRAPGVYNVLAQLDSLRKLRDQGLLSQAEYNASVNNVQNPQNQNALAR